MISHLKFSRKCWWLPVSCVLVAVAVALLTLQGVTVGDDLGYLFADAQLHAGGGGRVSTLKDVLDTQISHFLTFNGRIIVHSLTQIMLMDGMRWIYALLNGSFFALMWIGVCRLCAASERISPRVAVCCLFLLWWLMPAPGVIWLSLVAFALNYLWPAVCAVWLLEGINRIFEGRCRRPVLWLLLAFVCGTLQESFALPLLGGIGLSWLIKRNRRLLYIGIALLCGAAALLGAPGNYAHASAGGGFSPEVLLHKTLFMLRDLFRTPLPWLALLDISLAFKARTRRLLRPDRMELLLLLSIGCALLLGVLSYTALHQLVAPSLFAVILIGRIGVRVGECFSPRGRQMLAGVALTLTLFLMGAGYLLRMETAERLRRVETAVARGETILWIDCSGAPYNNPLCSILLRRMDDDPFADDLLHIVFDANTRKGLWRRHSPSPEQKKSPEILPVTRDSIRKAGRQLPIRRELGLFPVHPLDARYSLLITQAADTLPDLRFPDDTHLQFASVKMGDTLYLVVPAQAKTVRIKTLH